MDNIKERQRIGNTIRKARKENKITQKDLSDALKIRQDVISDYENGKIKVIPFEKRVKISSILGIDFANLLYENESIPLSKTIIDSAGNAVASVNKAKGFPYDNGKIDEIIDALSEREIATYKEYFMPLSSICSLAELLYIIFATLLKNNVWEDWAQYVISGVLEYRFITAGMTKKSALYDARQLALPLTYIYAGLFNNINKKPSLEHYFPVDTSSSDFKKKLSDALSRFNKRDFN